MEITRFGALSDEDRAQLEGDEPDPFDAAGIELAFRPKDRHVGIRDPDGRLIASAGFVLAEVEVDGSERHEVLGIGGVIVAAAHRGRGLARAVVGAALDEGVRLGPEYALLFCAPEPLRPVPQARVRRPRVSARGATATRDGGGAATRDVAAAHRSAELAPGTGRP